MPYRTSALATRTREIIPLPTVLGLRFLALSFALAAAACVLVFVLLARDTTGEGAFTIGAALPRVMSFAIPVGMALVGIRTLRDTRVRSIALGTAALWIAALLVEIFFYRFQHSSRSCEGDFIHESFGFSLPAIVVIVICRALGFAGLASIPFFAAPRRVFGRWAFLAAGAIAIANTYQAAVYAHDRVLWTWLEPSISSLVMFGLLAYGFHDLARVLREESVDERADRLPLAFPRLFATPEQRAAFIGPVRLATDLVAALAVVTFATTAGPLAYGFSLRGSVLPTGVDACVLFASLGIALIWLRRAIRGSLAPAFAAIAAAAVAIFSASSGSGAVGSAALFIVPAGIIGLVVVAPRAEEGAVRTMRRWVTTISAAGVLLGSAGFFALTATSTLSASWGEPALSRLAKVLAVGFAIAAANASNRLTLHARIELAAEQREP